MKRSKAGSTKAKQVRGAAWWTGFRAQLSPKIETPDYVALFTQRANLRPAEYMLGGKVVTL